MSTEVALPAPSLWDVRQASVYLGMSVSWIYKKTNEGYLPCKRIGQNLKFDPQALKAWVEKQGK